MTQPISSLDLRGQEVSVIVMGQPGGPTPQEQQRIRIAVQRFFDTREENYQRNCGSLLDERNRSCFSFLHKSFGRLHLFYANVDGCSAALKDIPIDLTFASTPEEVATIKNSLFSVLPERYKQLPIGKGIRHVFMENIGKLQTLAAIHFGFCAQTSLEAIIGEARISSVDFKVGQIPFIAKLAKIAETALLHHQAVFFHALDILCVVFSRQGMAVFKEYLAWLRTFPDIQSFDSAYGGFKKESSVGTLSIPVEIKEEMLFSLATQDDPQLKVLLSFLEDLSIDLDHIWFYAPTWFVKQGYSFPATLEDLDTKIPDIHNHIVTLVKKERAVTPVVSQGGKRDTPLLPKPAEFSPAAAASAASTLVSESEDDSPSLSPHTQPSPPVDKQIYEVVSMKGHHNKFLHPRVGRWISPPPFASRFEEYSASDSATWEDRVVRHAAAIPLIQLYHQGRDRYYTVEGLQCTFPHVVMKKKGVDTPFIGRLGFNSDSSCYHAYLHKTYEEEDIGPETPQKADVDSLANRQQFQFVGSVIKIHKTTRVISFFVQNTDFEVHQISRG